MQIVVRPHSLNCAKDKAAYSCAIVQLVKQKKAQKLPQHRGSKSDLYSSNSSPTASIAVLLRGVSGCAAMRLFSL